MDFFPHRLEDTDVNADGLFQLKKITSAQALQDIDEGDFLPDDYERDSDDYDDDDDDDDLGAPRGADDGSEVEFTDSDEEVWLRFFFLSLSFHALFLFFSQRVDLRSAFPKGECLIGTMTRRRRVVLQPVFNCIF